MSLVSLILTTLFVLVVLVVVQKLTQTRILLGIEFVDIVCYGGYILFAVSFTDLFFNIVWNVFDVLIFFVVCESLFLIDHQTMFCSSLIRAIVRLCGNAFVVGISVLFILVVLSVIVCLFKIVIN